MVFVWVLLSAAPVLADVRVPQIFSDNLVLQRGMEIPVWGWADPGEEVAIRIGQFGLTTTANDSGTWSVKLPAMEAGGPFELVVSGKNTLRLQNVLVGEVWVCSGQSNMEWSVRASKNPEEEAAAASYPEIRLFHVPRRALGQPATDLAAVWRPCQPDSVVNFSAVAYYFGREIHQKLDVPVGLINTSWGGTRIEPWTPPAGFEAVPELASVVAQIEQAQAAFRESVRPALLPLEDWIRQCHRALAVNEPIPPMPAIPSHPLAHHARPTGLYNGMVHPIVPYAIRGAIWYQGESNRTDGMAYFHKMKALINGWRSVWGQGNFPFYFVQLAPFQYREGPLVLAELREAQTAALSVPNTGMAVTMDIGNLKDIHPRNKQDVGKRLALWALAGPYEQVGVVFSGPVYKTMTLENDRIRILFEHTGSGLASRDGAALTWFEIAGDDKSFHKAQAEIDGNTVVVWSEAVPAPKAVRYGWHQDAEPNLANKEGLPAVPFRTHPW
jgi:sialate O-acetylesterase